MSTMRQVEANRLNAQKSSGPVTEEGKRRSRLNAVSHGLTGQGVIVPAQETEELARRLEDWRGTYRIETPEDEWLYNRLVVSAFRVERCQTQEFAEREYLAIRATDCWEEDRALEAARLGERIAKRPDLVVKQLRATKHGCEWLIDRWTELALVLDGGGAWDEALTQRALDLLGVRPDVRANMNLKDPLSLAAGQIAQLRQSIDDRLHAVDQDEQVSAESGLSEIQSAPLKLIRRYEAASMNQYLDARRQLLKAANPQRVEKPQPSAPVVAPPPAPLPPKPPVPRPTNIPADMIKPDCMTLDEWHTMWKRYENDIPRAQRLAAAAKATPPPAIAEAVSAPPPAVAPLRLADAVPTDPPHMNRRMRKAALRKEAAKR